MANQENDISLSALKIALIYLVVAALWIAFTDQLLDALITDPEYLSIAQTYKGWIYVALTSLGLFYLIKKHDRQVTEKDEKIDELSQKFQLEKELSDILFERIPVLINIYDPDLEEFRINKEFEKVTGRTNKEVRNINFMEACFPDLELRKEVAAFMEQPGIGWKEFPLTTKSGEQLPTSWTNIRLTDDTSVGIGIDMTEIKASQAKLRESRELLRRTFESLEESIILVDPDTRTITDCNKGTEKIFGYSQEELIGESTRKLHVSDTTFEKFDQMGAQSLDDNGIFKTEFVMQKKDGSTFYSGHTVTFVYDEEGEVDKVVSVVRDISKQKQYQKRLEERNKFIETTLENLPIGVSVNTIDDGETTFINEMFTEIYGWPAEDLDSVQNFFECVYADKEFREEMRKQVMADLESGDPERMDWKKVPITTKEGKRKYVNNKAIPLYQQNLMISTVVDVTEQHEYEEKLKRRQERLLRSQEIGQIGDWEFDPDTGNIHWSPMMYEIYDRDPDLGPPTFKQIKNIYSGGTNKKHNSVVKQAIEEGTSYDVDLQIDTEKGNHKYIRAIGIPVTSNSGKVTMLRGVVQDITERKKIEIMLRENRRRIETITNNVPGVVFRYKLNPDGTDELNFVSNGAKKIWGLNPEEAHKNNELIWERIHDSDFQDVQKAIQISSEKLTPWNSEWRYEKPDGSIHWHRGTGIPNRQSDGSIIWDSIVTDITEQKELQKKIIQSVIEGEDRERKRIALELHDGLGQYLVAANMNFQSIKSAVNKQLPEKREKQFKTGLSHLQKALSETRSIAYNLMPKAITDYGLVVALKNLIQDLQDSTEIEFTFNYNCKNMQLNDRAEVNIYRILQEIISNAVRHSECSQIFITLKKTNDILQLTVEDNGIGIKLDSEHEEQGLGLRSIKTRVKSLNGTLKIQSEPEEGMKTIISIPDIDSLKQNGEF